MIAITVASFSSKPFWHRYNSWTLVGWFWKRVIIPKFYFAALNSPLFYCFSRWIKCRYSSKYSLVFYLFKAFVGTFVGHCERVPNVKRLRISIAVIASLRFMSLYLIRIWLCSYFFLKITSFLCLCSFRAFIDHFPVYSPFFCWFLGFCLESWSNCWKIILWIVCLDQ